MDSKEWRRRMFHVTSDVTDVRQFIHGAQQVIRHEFPYLPCEGILSRFRRADRDFYKYFQECPPRMKEMVYCAIKDGLLKPRSEGGIGLKDIDPTYATWYDDMVAKMYPDVDGVDAEVLSEEFYQFMVYHTRYGKERYDEEVGE